MRLATRLSVHACIKLDVGIVTKNLFLFFLVAWFGGEHGLEFGVDGILLNHCLTGFNASGNKALIF